LGGRIDPQFLAKVKANCVVVGNRVEIDTGWWAQQVAAAAFQGAVQASGSPVDAVLDLFDIAGNVKRLMYGREYRSRVVSRMDSLDHQRAELEIAVRQGDADEFDVQLMLAQSIPLYHQDIAALWEAYSERYKHPWRDHRPWPS